MNKTPITDACFLAQGEPPEALIERLAKRSRWLEERLAEIAIEHVHELAEVTGERDAYREAIVLSETTRHEWAERAIASKADRDRIAAENAKLRAALEQMAAEWKIRMEDCESDRQRSITHRDDIAADESLSVFRAIKECHRELSEALRTGGAK